jgi:hypothetical protein
MHKLEEFVGSGPDIQTQNTPLRDLTNAKLEAIAIAYLGFSARSVIID